MSDIIHIKEPFYTAGRKFGWDGRPIGLGISLAALTGEGNLRVTVGDSARVWVIDKEDARAIVKRYNSIFEARGTKLGVLPWASFQSEDRRVYTRDEKFELEYQQRIKNFRMVFGNNYHRSIIDSMGKLSKIEKELSTKQKESRSIPRLEKEIESIKKNIIFYLNESEKESEEASSPTGEGGKVKEE